MSTHFKGPIISENGIKAASGNTITLIKKGTGSFVFNDVPPGMARLGSITTADAQVGDMVQVTPPSNFYDTYSDAVLGHACVRINGAIDLSIISANDTFDITGATVAGFSYTLIRVS